MYCITKCCNIQLVTPVFSFLMVSVNSTVKTLYLTDRKQSLSVKVIAVPELTTRCVVSCMDMWPETVFTKRSRVSADQETVFFFDLSLVMLVYIFCLAYPVQRNQWDSPKSANSARPATQYCCWIKYSHLKHLCSIL